MSTPDPRQALPAVDRLLNTATASTLIADYGRDLTVDAVRNVLADARADLQAANSTPPDADALLGRAADRLAAITAPTLFPVINATGVIIHTNLGRAPLSAAARQAMLEVAHHYNTLEFNMDTGKRGKRFLHAEQLLTRLTGAEAAMVVNNNAAAVMLILGGLANRRKVVISRGELVEIGGGFRVPDVLRQSGAKLLEVGTTNRTHLRDYEAALRDDSPALVMRAHASNYRVIGFTTAPDFKDVVALSHQYDVPVVDDLGSGAFIDPARFGLGHEPLVQGSIAAGTDVISFSGDKLLGGPQAGIIVGKRRYIDKLKKHPLTRAIRPDKLALAALSATLLHYLKGEALDQVPVWRMIAMPLDHIRQRADTIAAAIGATVVEGRSTVGGGSLPEETLPTWLVQLPQSRPDRVLTRLRAERVIARIQDDRAVLDPRTVLIDDNELIDRLSRALAGR